jgi:hypothetical protein
LAEIGTNSPSAFALFANGTAERSFARPSMPTSPVRIDVPTIAAIAIGTG